jgi:phospho-N-acetylmuramoyl-pentapeptide-transferase
MLDAFAKASAIGLLAFIVCVSSMPILIAKLKQLRLGQMIQSDGPAHQAKSNTPTMAGLWLIVVWLAVSLLFVDASNPYIVINLMVGLGFMALGMVDDLAKIAYRDNNLGLSVRMKLVGQMVLAGGAVAWWLAIVGHESVSVIQFPQLLGGLRVDLGWLYPLFAVLVIVGSSNSVNLTDGLDGLVSVPIMLVCLGLSVAVAHYDSLMPNGVLQDALLMQALPDVSIVLMVLGAVFLGFLVFNCYPAEVFLGDTGSLSVGALLATMALLLKLEVYFAVMSGLFILEALSVMVQVGGYKWCKKRVLLMAPFHHHFEKKGWHEKKVVVRLWIMATIFLVLSCLLMVTN